MVSAVSTKTEAEIECGAERLAGQAGGTFADLEQAADRLLEAAGALGRRNGIYTSATLARKIRGDRERLTPVDECGLPSEVVERLVEQRVEELMDVSRLDLREEIVFRLRVCGLNIGQIAATLNVRPRHTATLLRAAQRKVRRAYRDGRYAGWYEVYLSEVNRPAYRRRK